MASESESPTVSQEMPPPARLAPSGRGKLRKLLGMSSTFLTVALLTLLLWVLADQSQLVEQEMPLAFTLATEATSPLVLMSVTDGSGESAQDTGDGGKRLRAKVKFQGSRSRLRELQADIQAGRLALLVYLSPPAYWADTYEVPVVDLLNADEQLLDRGVTVTAAAPETITVVLDEWVTMEKIRLTLNDNPASRRFQASIDPPEIAVEVPSSLRQTNPKELLVEPGPLPDKITPNLEIIGTVATEISGQPVRPQQTKVKVILQPTRYATAKLGPLQIEACLPSEMIGSYDLEFEHQANRVVEVEVQGPPAELDKLKAAAHQMVWAYIRLSNQHAKPTEAYYPVPVQFEFIDAQGVSLVGPNRTVKVRLKKKPTQP